MINCLYLTTIKILNVFDFTATVFQYNIASSDRGVFYSYDDDIYDTKTILSNI